MEALDASGADALIVSDLGAFSLAKRYAPHMELHVSTQASVMNAEAARAWHDLGASRVVVAREMSMEDIAELRAQAPRDLEIEAFVHGAMCMAFSGRCIGQQRLLRAAVPLELCAGGGEAPRCLLPH